MTGDGLFLQGIPGLEDVLAEEARSIGLEQVRLVPGGAECAGGWPDAWRANLRLRTCGRVLVRVAEFRAMHLAQLDKRTRKMDWAGLLPEGAQVRVEATCRKSRIYHDRAAKQRVERAIAEAVQPSADGPELSVSVRIEDDLCTISLDSSGAPLHKRGWKRAVGKAPLRETMAAAMLMRCGFDGAEPVIDPMCGSGTFVIEAAQIAAGLWPGRDRRFAFETLGCFDADAYADMRGQEPAQPVAARFRGFDRDAGAVKGATENANRAGVGAHCDFACQPITALERPDGAPGLIMVNPPYGARIGNRKLLFALYGSLGEVLRARFGGWRIGLVTSDRGLATATGLDWDEISAPLPLGGLKVRLYRSGHLRPATVSS